MCYQTNSRIFRTNMDYISEQNVFEVPSEVNQTLQLCKQAYRNIWATDKNSEVVDEVLNLLSHLASKYEKVGEGSSRTVYRVNDHLVLKVGIGSWFMDSIKNLEAMYNPDVVPVEEIQNILDVGTAQNGAELAATQNQCIDRSLVAGVIKYTPDLFAVVAEYATPIDQDLFKKSTGVSWSDFKDWMFLLGSGTKDMKDHVKGLILAKGQKPFLKKFYNGITRCDLDAVDFAQLHHFGSIGNRLVIVDYGFTADVRKSYYSESKLCSAAKKPSAKLLMLQNEMKNVIKKRANFHSF